MTKPSDTPHRKNCYLGTSEAPPDWIKLRQELEDFLSLLEFQLGAMNKFPRKEFLTEQPVISRSALFRWITKALLKRDTRFLKDLARALTNISEHPALISNIARQFRQSASALSLKGDPDLDALLKKLRNTKWLASASLEEVQTLEAEVQRRYAVGREAFEKSVQATLQYPDRPEENKPLLVQQVQYHTVAEPELPTPAKPGIVKHTEKSTGKSRKGINVSREMRAARLELPRGKAGRPPERKRR